MTLRAIMLGLSIAMFVAGFTYFNDWVMRQSQFAGSYLPFSVFGLALVLLFASLLPGLLSGRGRGGLGAGEMAVIISLGLAACAWPGASFGYSFSLMTAMPAHWHQTASHWQAANVMSYVPGGSQRVAAGHVQDWRALVAEVEQGRAGDGPSVGRQLWLHTTDSGRMQFEQAVGRQGIELDIAGMTEAVNAALPAHDFASPELLAQLEPELEGEAAALAARRMANEPLTERETLRLNRALLVTALPGTVMPPPSGTGAMFGGGQPERGAVDAFYMGAGAKVDAGTVALNEVPWAQWWPVVRLWGGVALLMGIASLCMALIVHPQWMRHEHLAYPLARFVQSCAERRGDSLLPDILRQRLFWVGMLSLFALHALNGMQAWFEYLPHIELSLDFNKLRELFPTASRVPTSRSYFSPHIFLSVVAFAFFVSSSVSLSLGLSQLLFIAGGALLLAYGIPVGQARDQATNVNMLRFGAFMGMGLMILYTGRYYYTNVLAATLGRRTDATAYPVWAARLLALVVILAVWLLTTSGLDWPLALVLVLVVMLLHVVLSRIVCETGVFFLSSPFMPVAALLGLAGFGAIGPTGLLLLVLGGWMIGESRHLAMPYISTALALGEHNRIAPRRLGSWLGLALALGLAVTVAATLVVQYSYGVSTLPGWHVQGGTSAPFNMLAREHSEALALHTLQDATAVTGLARITRLDPAPGTVGWTTLGLMLVVGTAILRLRVPWWPIHPVMFLLWGTWAMTYLAFSFLIGWMIKAAVVQVSGTRGYHLIRPLMVGVIAGELLAALGWSIVGAIYFYYTGQVPSRYPIFPPLAI